MPARAARARIEPGDPRPTAEGVTVELPVSGPPGPARLVDVSCSVQAWVRRADLPAGTSDFLGRADELEWLTEGRRRDPADTALYPHTPVYPDAGHHPDTGDRPTVLAIDGVAGVGKTALALRVAHRLAPACPDGQLYLDLRGHTPGRSPRRAEDALAELLRAVGLPEADIPDTTSGRAAAWRERLAGRAVLLLLDNARAVEQVEPLLPDTPRAVVIVTSRRELTSLAGVRNLSLDPLPLGEAHDLFDRITGSPAAVDPKSASRVVQLCAGLPLAVELTATRLRGRPDWTVAELLSRLDDTRERLIELRAGELTVSAAFEVSYQELSDQARLMFRRVAEHPGDDLDAPAAAALAGLELTYAEDALRDLVDHHLLEQPRPGRYQPHDALRGYAIRLAELQDTPAERAEAIDRLLDQYLELAIRGRAGGGVGLHGVGLPGVELDDLVTSVAGAASHGRHGGAWRLAVALFDHLAEHRRYRTGLRLYELALDSARRSGSRAGIRAVLRRAEAMRARLLAAGAGPTEEAQTARGTEEAGTAAPDTAPIGREDDR
jgi:NB-ARC domain